MQCEQQADGEDGLCSNCRARNCPRSPLGWFAQQVDEIMRGDMPASEWSRAFDDLHEEYERRCLEAGEQP